MKKMNMKNLSLLVGLILSQPLAAQSVNVSTPGAKVQVNAGGAVSVSTGAMEPETKQTSKKSKSEGQTYSSVNGASVINSAVGAGAVAETNIAGRQEISVGSTGQTQVNTKAKAYVNTDISGRNFSAAKLAGVTMTNVDANSAIFKQADLSGAKFTNIDLSKADLRGANLKGAHFLNVDWEDALLEGAVWIDGRRCGAGSIGVCR